VHGLRALGYVEGRNLILERRTAEGKIERLGDIATELVRLNVDVLVVTTTPAAQAALNATRTIPIVMAAVGDPVEAGLVASLAKPGGNITGLSQMNIDISGKRIEVLKRLMPGLARVAVFWNPSNRFHAQFWKETDAAARTLTIELEGVEVRRLHDLEPAFGATTRGKAQALVAFDDALFYVHRSRIVALAAANQLPTLLGFREFPEAGGLMSYGASVPDLFRRAAAYVDKILKGANPAELPIEQPTKFELVINLKTATALGLTIPPALLARADELIE
jgi:putative ABC transport system substrate-binding protein